MTLTVTRKDGKIQATEISDQYLRVKNRVDLLQVRISDGVNLDSDLIISAIDDVKRYMKTLVGELKIKPIKDSLPIRMEMLHTRLSEIERLAHAISKAQKDDCDQILLEAQNKVKHEISYGAILSSNLKSLLFKTHKNLLTGKIQLRTPEEYICPITSVIMRDPVVAADGYAYEREAIQNWIESQKKIHINTNAISVKTNTPLENHDLYPDSILKEEIRDYIKIYGKAIPIVDLPNNAEVPTVNKSYHNTYKH